MLGIAELREGVRIPAGVPNRKVTSGFHYITQALKHRQ